MRALTDEEMKTVLDKVRLSLPPYSWPAHLDRIHLESSGARPTITG